MITIPADDVETVVHLCPCEGWQVEYPVGELDDALPGLVEEVVADHMAECIVLAASSLTARAVV